MTLFNSELKVGDKALIINGRTEEGRRNIGKIVMCELEMQKGDRVLYEGSWWWADGGNGFIVSGHIVSSHGVDGSALFNKTDLMPLPKLDEPSIEDVTFTPIVQKDIA